MLYVCATAVAAERGQQFVAAAVGRERDECLQSDVCPRTSTAASWHCDQLVFLKPSLSSPLHPVRMYVLMRLQPNSLSPFYM